MTRWNRAMSVTVTLRDVLEVMARYDVTQETIARAVHCDPAMISRMKRGETSPSRERAQQMADCLAALVEEHGLPSSILEEYLMPWMISCGYVPRTVAPAGRLVLAQLACLRMSDQQKFLSRTAKILKDIQARGQSDSDAQAEPDDVEEVD